MRVSILAAVAANRIIGRRNALPWHLPADLRRFKRLTLGHHLIMGRRTWESLGRPLPGRVSVVLSRGAPQLPEGVRQARSLDEALVIARQAGDTEAFVVGGAEVYRQALPLADRLYITWVDADVEGDASFPPIPVGLWKEVSRETPVGEAQQYPCTFAVYERQGPDRGPQPEKG